MITSTCKNCNNSFSGKFCNTCGQKVYTDDDKSLHHIFTELFHFLTHFEGTFFTTLKIIFTKPGQLSLDYCNGIRKKYFKPISFYLLIVVIYLFFPMARGLNPTFDSMKSEQLLGYNFSKKIESIQQEKKYSDDVISIKYSKTSDKISKLLLFILIPFGAIALYLLSYKKKFAFDYFIFSTEINIFFILSFYVFVPVILFPFIYFKLIANMDFDYIAGPISGILYVIYLIKAFNTYFKEKYFWSIARAIVFPIFHFGFIFIIYRLILYNLSLQFL